jgi:hypothetical protein
MKKIAINLAFVLPLLLLDTLSAAQTKSAVAGMCFAISDNDNSFYSVTMSPEANPLPSPIEIEINRDFNGEGSAYRAYDKGLYVFQAKGDNKGPSDLYKIDTRTGEISLVKERLLSGSVDGAEFYYDSQSKKEIFYVLSGEDRSKLYAYYADDWSLLDGYPISLHGDITGLSSIAINPLTGDAYGVDDYNYDHLKPKLYEVDLSTGQTTFKVELSQVVDAEGLAYASDGNLYIEDEVNADGRKIYKVDLENGNLIPAALLGGSGDIEGLSCNGMEMTPVESEPFTCSQDAYLFNDRNPSKVHTIDLSNGATARVGTIEARFINGTGYNVNDNLIWGYDIDNHKVVKIDANYNVTEYEVGALPEGRYFAGDVSQEGLLYLKKHNDSKIYIIDLNSGTPSYLGTVTLKENGTISSANFGDFAFSPIDDMLYGISEKNDATYNHLYRIDPSNGNMEDLGIGNPEVAVEYHTFVFDVDGNLYFYGKRGKIYRIEIARGIYQAELFSETENRSAGGDGARCPNAAVKPPVSPPKPINFNAWDIGESLTHAVIHTKVAGEDIRLTLASLNADGTALAPNHAKELKVSLFSEGDNLLRGWIDVAMEEDHIDVTFPKDMMRHPHRAYKDVQVAIRYKDQKDEVHTLFSSDHFAIRPNRYAIELPTDLIAGKPFIVTLKALDAEGVVVENYNESHNVYRLDANETNSSMGCVTGHFDFTPVSFSDGIARFNADYSEVGYLRLRLSERRGRDSEFALVDKTDTPERYIASASQTSSAFKAKGLRLTWRLKDGGLSYTYYSNDLNKMAAELEVNATAINYDGAVVRNFTPECYAKDLYIGVTYSADSAAPVDQLQFNSTEVLHDSSNGQFVYVIDRSAFNYGTVSDALRFNFSREVDHARNPARFTVSRLQAKIDGGSFIPFSSEEKSTTFVYARAYVPDQSVVGDTLHAKVYYEVYCKGCDRSRYGLESFVESVDQVGWYQLPLIGTKLDFSIPHPIGTSPDASSGGTISAATSVLSKYFREDRRHVMMEVKKTPSNVTGEYRPESYLRYNPFNSAATLQRFTARFSKAPRDWGGRGSVGYTVDTNIEARKGSDRKLDW